MLKKFKKSQKHIISVTTRSGDMDAAFEEGAGGAGYGGGGFTGNGGFDGSGEIVIAVLTEVRMAAIMNFISKVVTWTIF